MKNQIFAIFLMLALHGCASSSSSQSQAEIQAAFVASEHDAYKANGNESIKGISILHTENGGKLTCAGNEVGLLPATPFFREVVAHWRNGFKASFSKRVASGYTGIIKKSQCDGTGGFAFTGLPVCTWFVVTHAEWTTAGLDQGGLLVREVSACSPEPIELNNNDIAGPYRGAIFEK